MRSLNNALALAAMSAALALAPAAQAGDDVAPNQFVRMASQSKDGMVSKAEVMKMVEKAFDKQDTKKMGKLDKKQADAFLQDLMLGGN